MNGVFGIALFLAGAIVTGLAIAAGYSAPEIRGVADLYARTSTWLLAGGLITAVLGLIVVGRRIAHG